MNIVVVGLGYVGLPLALNLAKHFKVIGFDINEERISELAQGKDRNNEISEETFAGVSNNISFSTDQKQINNGDVIIICVPTPITKDRKPDLRPLQGASATVGKNIKKGATVVYESTTYPGCTEEVCLPILEKESGMKLGDFQLGYSPERMNPGDKNHSIDMIYKIVSGNSKEALDKVDEVYSKITKTHRVSSIKTAEAAKIIENIQRDVNIALFNELSMLFDKMDLDSKEVFDAAATKWNFLRFYPGYVGGHCIPVDPYYLATKAAELNFRTDLLLAGRMANEIFPLFVARKLVSLFEKTGKDLSKCKVLVLGATYKANVPDLRDSKVQDMIAELKEREVSDVCLYEPIMNMDKIFDVQNTKPEGKYDAIVLAVPHKEFEQLDIPSMLNENGILIDIPRKFDKTKLDGLTYWGP